MGAVNDWTNLSPVCALNVELHVGHKPAICLFKRAKLIFVKSEISTVTELYRDKFLIVCTLVYTHVHAHPIPHSMFIFMC